ncbi:NAD(+)/NADH kinase [Porcipelethomonas sp.]|uniref:NAD(+)/NADH kinase n=1 Tax=Porcipelethomonas sp. TaxID=2981675 RepID=UPI003EFA1D5A
MKAAIFPNFQKNNALDCARKLCDILNINDIEVYVDNSYKSEFNDKTFINYGLFDEFAGESDFAIAIGGDGTILKCAKHIIDADTKLLGINTGRLGFMSALEYDQLDRISDLKSGNYKISERMMMNVKIDSGGSIYELIALNDVSVSGIYSSICDFNIYADGNIIGSYRADGAVFSTPTGSTAYSLSAGGPIIEPEMECIEMTLICPHSLFTRPMIFSPEKKIRFENSLQRNPEIFVSVDGGEAIKLSVGSSVEVSKSEHKIKLVSMTENFFYNSLNNKFMHPIK